MAGVEKNLINLASSAPPNFSLLVYERQERPNSATLIFWTAGGTTVRQVRSRILEAVKSFFRDRERAKMPKK